MNAFMRNFSNLINKKIPEISTLPRFKITLLKSFLRKIEAI
jgi:hypothetical protein